MDGEGGGVVSGSGDNEADSPLLAQVCVCGRVVTCRANIVARTVNNCSVWRGDLRFAYSAVGCMLKMRMLPFFVVTAYQNDIYSSVFFRVLSSP